MKPDKTSFYQSHLNESSATVFSERESHEHIRRRRALAHAYSQSNVRQMEGRFVSALARSRGKSKQPAAEQTQLQDHGLDGPGTIQNAESNVDAAAPADEIAVTHVEEFVLSLRFFCGRGLLRSRWAGIICFSQESEHSRLFTRTRSWPW
jgi:hypothetical protein